MKLFRIYGGLLSMFKFKINSQLAYFYFSINLNINSISVYPEEVNEAEKVQSANLKQTRS